MVKADENGDGTDRPLEPEQFRKLFVGGLTSAITDENLKDFFSQFGEILDFVVMKDPATKRSRGFGFVTFANQEQVDAAMSKRPHVIEGKTVDTRRANPRDQAQKAESNVTTKRLYVSGVREEHTEDVFKEYFSKFGTVLSVEIMQDKATGKPRGFAFISFDDYDAVDKCVLIKSHQIANFRCDVKKALSKEEMAKAQQQERERMFRGDRSRGPVGGGYGGGWGSDRGGYGGSDAAWTTPGYGAGARGGQWGPPGGGAGSYYGGGGYGSGYGGSSAPGAGGRPGGWGPRTGGAGGWQSGQGGGAGSSWGGAGGSQGGWGGRGY